MTRGVRRSLVGSVVLVALIALAGCGHYLFAEREPWRHEAEVACLNSGVVTRVPGRVRISAIEGPGICGIDYPLKVSALGDSTPLAYTGTTPRPPGSIPTSYPPSLAGQGRAEAPQHWPAIQSNALPPPQSAPKPEGIPPYTSPPYAAPQAGAPVSLRAPGLPPPDEDDGDIPGGPPHPYYGGPVAAPAAPAYSPRPPAPLGPPASPMTTAQAGPVELKPPAKLACPIVSALDQWVSEALQPAALKWFGQPVVEIKQIGSYSCRGMNGNPNAHISEHAFGNALDIAEFDLADGHRISVQYGWHGTPQEQGFLHDVQGSACQDFTTVLAPGANVYHYNHIHVDLMRRRGRPYICEPAPIPGEVAAARARAYAAEHNYPDITGSIGNARHRRTTADRNDDDRLPLAIPGRD
jgi:hypothetical protein